VSNDRTPPKDAEGAKPTSSTAKPASDAAKGPSSTAATPAGSGSGSGAKPVSQNPSAANPASPKTGAAAGQPQAKPATKPAASSPSPTKPSSSTASPSKAGAGASAGAAGSSAAVRNQPASATPRTGTAPQPVVATPAPSKATTPPQYRAQPKSSAASGPPTEAFDPIADDRRGSGAPAPVPAAPPRPVGPRRARLLVSRLDPWSVMKTAFMLAVSLAIVMLVATAVLWYALQTTGVFDAIGKVVNDLAGSGSANFNFASLVGFGRVMGVALIIAALEIVLTSALSTLFAFLYNLSVGLTGGVEVTLSEES